MSYEKLLSIDYMRTGLCEGGCAEGNIGTKGKYYHGLTWRLTVLAVQLALKSITKNLWRTERNVTNPKRRRPGQQLAVTERIKLNEQNDE